MPNFIRDVDEIRERAIRNLEEGAVTEAYELDAERSVAILNDALATEIVCVLRYLHHYFMATGVHAKAVSAEFKEHADAEREHADELAERIQQLGGKPDFNPKTLLERSVSQYVEGETLGDMIREDLIAERVVIDVYNQMIRYFGEKDPTTRVLLEHILAEEEEHASDLSDLLYIVEPSSGETEGEDPGVRPLEISRGRGEGGQRNAQQSNTQSSSKQSAQKQSAQVNEEEEEDDEDFNEAAVATRGGMGGHTAKGVGRNQQRAGAQQESDSDTDAYVGHIDRDAREPRPMAQTIADREGGSSRGGAQRGNQRNQGTQSGGRTQGVAQRQSTEQFAGRGSVNASRGGRSENRGSANASSDRNTEARGNANASRGVAGLTGTVRKGTSTQAGSADARRAEANRTQGEMRPSRATGSGRQDARNAKPEHEPGTTGRRRRADEPAASIDRGEEGGMGGGTRAVRVTNKQRKNRAA